MDLSSVNYLAAIVGAVFNMALGTMWYGPLFGKLWLRLIEKTQDDIESKPVIYIYAFVAAFLASVVLSMIVIAAGATGFFSGVLIGLIVWLGIVATVTLTFSIFEGPKLSVWALFAAYQLVIFAVLGGVFAVW